MCGRERVRLGDGVWDGRTERRGGWASAGGGCCIRRERCWAGESAGLWSAGFKRERERIHVQSVLHVPSLSRRFGLFGKESTGARKVEGSIQSRTATRVVLIP